MISHTCHNSVDLSLTSDIESVAGSMPSTPVVNQAGPCSSPAELPEAIGEEHVAGEQEDAWLASLINQRRDAIELSEAIFQARLQAERDQEQQRLQDLLRRMMAGLNETPAAETATACS